MITVSFKGLTKIENLLTGLPKNIKKEIGNGMFQIAKNHQRGLRTQLNRTSQRFDYKIWNSIKAKKLSDNQSVVGMAKEGFMLDSMKTHWVSLKPGRAITAWAMTRFNGPLPSAIQVRAHPFVINGLARGKAGKDKILQDSLDLAIKNSRG